MGFESSGNLILSHNLSLSNLFTCGTKYLFMQILSHNRTDKCSILYKTGVEVFTNSGARSSH